MFLLNNIAFFRNKPLSEIDGIEIYIININFQSLQCLQNHLFFHLQDSK